MNPAYILTRILLALFAALPLPLASALGGFLMQLIGPLTGRHKVAKKNLAVIFPDKPPQWHAATAKAMWNHMGRVLAELPALKSGELLKTVSFPVPSVSSQRKLGLSNNTGNGKEIPAFAGLTGEEFLKSGQQAIYVSAHLGQWELLVPTARAEGVSQITSLYRHINNEKLDALLLSYRQNAHDKLVRKKGDNAFALVKALKSGDSLGLLIDQRLTKGEVFPFLGVDAPTNMVAIKLSLKTSVPVIPAFIIRKAGPSFEAVVYPPIYPPEQGTEEEKTAAMATQMFSAFEEQIRAHPAQYMWTHNRWKRS